MKEIIATKSAPAAIGPYSQGIGAGNLVITSGQLPVCSGCFGASGTYDGKCHQDHRFSQRYEQLLGHERGVRHFLSSESSGAQRC